LQHSQRIDGRRENSATIRLLTPNNWRFIADRPIPSHKKGSSRSRGEDALDTGRASLCAYRLLT
jgi:hypothetical protein